MNVEFILMGEKILVVGEKNLHAILVLSHKRLCVRNVIDIDPINRMGVPFLCR